MLKLLIGVEKMIMAKNISLNGDLLEMLLKYDTEENYEYFCYDIKNDKIIALSHPESKNIGWIYSHLIIPLLRQIENGNLKDTFFQAWY